MEFTNAVKIGGAYREKGAMEEIVDSMIEIGAIREVTEAEGPGRRFAVWVQGCSIRCAGCCNPHLFDRGGGSMMSVDDLLARVRRVRDRIDGVSVLGGEPFDQAGALVPFLEGVRGMGLSTVVFTGYLLERIEEGGIESGQELLRHIDVLVDGPFIQGRITRKRRWIGSDNQRAICLTDRLTGAFEKGESERNTVEIRLAGDRVSINGFPVFSERELRDLGLWVK